MVYMKLLDKGRYFQNFVHSSQIVTGNFPVFLPATVNVKLGPPLGLYFSFRRFFLGKMLGIRNERVGTRFL